MSEQADDLRSNVCPNCNAQPGQRCTQPTDTGRREVTLEHFSRTDARLLGRP